MEKWENGSKKAIVCTPELLHFYTPLKINHQCSI